MIDDEFDIIRARDVLEDIVKKFVKYSPILIPVGLALAIHACNEYKKAKMHEIDQTEETPVIYLYSPEPTPTAKPYKQNTSPK